MRVEESDLSVESGYQQGDGCTYELYHNDYTTLPEKNISWIFVFR